MPEMIDTPWIEWSGGERPIHGDKRVICELKDGRIMRAAKSRNREWDHIGDDTDIIAYRLVL